MQSIIRGSATDLKPTPPAVLTDNGFPVKIPTLTAPTGAAVLDLESAGSEAPLEALIVPFGTGNDDTTFNLRCIGWTRIAGDGNTGISDLWAPTILCDFLCTLGTVVGVDNTPLGHTIRFADTIAVNTEPTITAATTRQGTEQIYSPANNTIAWAKIRLHGVQRLEISVDINASATGGAALVALR
jgi:hypothetical protein